MPRQTRRCEPSTASIRISLSRRRKSGWTGRSTSEGCHLPVGRLEVSAVAHAAASFERSLPLRIGEISYTDYTFDAPWELVPGPWKIQFWLGDRKPAEQDFNVVVN
jgi:hypothetical protein